MNDSESVDSRVWREWMQLFVNDRSVIDEDNKLIDLNAGNDELLDDCEFLDYLYFIGQWKTDLIPLNSFTQINLVDLFQEVAALTQDPTNNKNVKPVKPNPNVKDTKDTIEIKEDGKQNN